MMILMTAALVAAQPVTVAHPQHGEAPTQHDEKMKDCCKDCCKDMHAKHDGHAPDERGNSGS